MKMFTIILASVFVMTFLLGLVNAGELKTTYTPTTDTVCNGKTCNLIVHSGIENVYEDNTWKKVENARSLKGSGITCSVDYDGVNYAECLDWNYSSITLKMKSSTTNKAIPIKLYSDKTIGKTLIDEKAISFKDNKEEKVQVVPYSMGNELHFGETSTTITLDSTYDLFDTMVRGAQSDGNYNTADTLFLAPIPVTGGKDIYFKWNITSIPAGQTINSATLNVYLVVNGADAGEDEEVSMWRLQNQIWAGNVITWNKRPSGTLTNISTKFIANNLASVWIAFDYTSGLQSDYDAGQSNSSMYLNITNGSVDDDINDDIQIYAKEKIGTTYDPYLNITYSESGVVPLATVTIVSPTNTTYASASQYINITSNGNATWYNWNGTNYTYTTPFLVDFGADGLKTLYVWANNSIGNETNKSVSFTIDTTPPTVNITSPTNGSTYTNATQLVNISSDGANKWYNWDGVNVTYTVALLVDFGTNGWKTLYAWANDTVGNINSFFVTFFINAPTDCDYTSGNWNINIPCIKNNTIINIDGNLSIGSGGSLELNNATLNFTSTNQWIVFDNVADETKLILTGNSTIN